MKRTFVRVRLVVLLLAAVVCLLPVSAASAAQTVALSSGSFAFEVEPGQSGSGEIVVICDGDEPIKVLVYVADVSIDEKGEQSYPLPERQGSNLLTTPSSWFRVFMPADSKSVGNTSYLELDPRERIPVKFDFAPPAGSAPGDHNIMVFFELFEFAQESEGSAVQISGRIGARIALRVNGEIVEKMDIRPFEVPSFVVGTKVPYRFTTVNGGNLNKPVAATVTLLDRSEKEVTGSQVASETTVYAKSNLEFTGTLDSIAGRLGPHTVEVRLEYSEEGAELPTEIVEQRTVWMFPLWLLIAVGAVVFVGAVAIATRVMRGRGPRADVGERSSRPARKAHDSGAEERRRLREERAVRESDAPLDDIVRELNEEPTEGE